MADIGVKPVRKGMALSHPLDGPLADEGGVWRDDQFTLRRLRDRDIKRVDAENDEPAPKEAKAKLKANRSDDEDGPSITAKPAPEPLPTPAPDLPAAASVQE